MTSYFTRKLNGEWDSSSLVGEYIGGIICHTCGAIADKAYNRGERYYCGNCFEGDKDNSLTVTYKEKK